MSNGHGVVVARSGFNHFHHFHNGVAFVGVGGWWWPPPPYYYPPAYYPPAYYPPAYYPQAAPAYGNPPDAGQVWYYCDNPQGYYPYIKECPGGWQQVAPQPPVSSQ